MEVDWGVREVQARGSRSIQEGGGMGRERFGLGFRAHIKLLGRGEGMRTLEELGGMGGGGCARHLFCGAETALAHLELIWALLHECAISSK